ncbi:hypothetical protein C8J56DRAFT_1025177 [Mycena floridula]|nr:hypothetical protein C8J56DRAFT_1025177 [Mycena floridula]
MISTTSSALLFLALTAASSLAAPIRIPIGARDVAAAPAVEQLVRRIAQAIPVAVEPRKDAEPDVSRRFPRRIYYEHYARNVATAASEDITARAPVPETPVVEARQIDTTAFAARNQRREIRKRTRSGEKAARAIVNVPGVKARAVGSSHPALEARQRTKYARSVKPAAPIVARAPVPAPAPVVVAAPVANVVKRAAEPVAAKPVARDVAAAPAVVVVREVTPPAVVARDNAIRHEVYHRRALEDAAKARRAEVASRPSLFSRVAQIARDNLYHFGDVVSNNHYHSTTDTAVHNGDSNTIVEITPIDDSTTVYDMPTVYDIEADGSSSDPSSSASPSAPLTGGKGASANPLGSGSGSFIPGGTASGTPTSSTDSSTVTSTPITPVTGGTATVTVTVTTTTTATTAPTGAPGDAASSSVPSGTPVVTGTPVVSGTPVISGAPIVSASGSVSADPAQATSTGTTGFGMTGLRTGKGTKKNSGASPATPSASAAPVARRDSTHNWMKMNRRATPVPVVKRNTPVQRRAERRSGVWARDLSS